MRKLGLGLTVVGLVTPSFLLAVGLGEISVDSYLNQPLTAEIQLVSTAASEVDGLQVRVAPDEIFQQIGIQRTNLHNQLEFTPVIKNGIPVITVTSTRSITEPFLNFVIEVAWPKGKLLREYTVLLDPPVFRQQQAQVTTAPAAVEPTQKAVVTPVMDESVAEPEATVAVTEKPELREVPPPVDNLDNIPLAETFPVTEPMPATEASGESLLGSGETLPGDEATPSAAVSYEVQSGDTLWKIADSYRSESVTVNQMMMALLRDNPKAFISNNINRLKRGYIMRIPDSGEAMGISNADALAEVKRQRSLWSQYKERLASSAMPQQPAIETPVDELVSEKAEEVVAEPEEATEVAKDSGSELEIIVPATTTDADAPGEGTLLADAGEGANLENEITLAKEQIQSQSLENEELRSRVSELEVLLNDKDRLIHLKDEQLLDIQQKLSDVEEAAQVPVPEAAAIPEEAPEIVEPVQETETLEPVTDQAEPVEENGDAAAEESMMAASSELMPRIPLEPTEEITATEEIPVEEAVEPVAEFTEDTAAEESEQLAATPTDSPEMRVTEPVQTAANTVSQEESKGFFKDLLNNPNLWMGTGFGALLLAGLGWLVARNKSSAELEVPNITRAPSIDAFAQDDDLVKDPVEAAKEEVKEIEGMLDIPDTDSVSVSDDELNSDFEAKPDLAREDELNDFIDTAFNIRTDELPEDAASGVTKAEDMLDAMSNIDDDTGSDIGKIADPLDMLESTSVEADTEIKTEVQAEIDPEVAPEELDSAGVAVDQGDDLKPESESEPEPELGPPTDFSDIIKEEMPESDEVLAEADVYLAYGLNEQAIELLKPALLDHPDRHDYRGKLLEALYAMEDKHGFIEEAGHLKSQLGEAAASSAVWGRIAAMGKDISPDESIFAMDSTASPALEEITPRKPDSIDIDLGADDFMQSELVDDELKETLIRGEGPADFSVPDDELAYQDTQAIEPEDMALALEDFDIPETDADSVETLMMDGATLHGLELTSLDNTGAVSGDATNEFQFDASALDEIGNEASDTNQDEGTASAESEESAQESKAEEKDDFVVDPDTTQIDLKKSEFKEDELSASLEMTQVINPDATTTSETDFTDLELAKETLAMNMLDEGEGEDEISLLTGEDEIDTKLDLAKAYIDMGDEEGAKDALDEVISSGSDEQRDEATKLLEQIG